MILMVFVISAQLPVMAGQNTRVENTGLEEVEYPATTGVDAEALPSNDKPVKEKKTRNPNRGRFLPIPIFITEPAVGDGLGLALAYFHRPKENLESKQLASPHTIGESAKNQEPPPTVSGIFAAYTSNKTAAAGIGHMNTFRDDHIRFRGIVGLADVYSTFYIRDHPIKFNLDGLLVYQNTRFRFGDSRWFWGIGLSYLDASIGFQSELPAEVPEDLFRHDLSNIGMSAEMAWDSRDNTSMPNDGQLFELALWRYDEAIGGDFDYWNAKLKLLSFHQLHKKFVLGLRFEYLTIDGNAPFFAIPWVSLRGIPAMRYQGDKVTVVEVEGRYNLSSKWAVIAFAGAGAVSSKISEFHTEQNIRSFGLGGRYRIFKAQNIWVGIDIARGPEEFNWYIQVGHAW